MSGESPFDALASRYDGWYEGKGKVAFETELAALRPLLADCPKPWLEVGVGTGRFASALGITHGIDPSTELLALARARGINVLWGEGEELVFPARSFGSIFLLTTWEFLADPARVLRECRRVLAPAGRLVNAFLDRDGKWGASYAARGAAGDELFRHARFDDFATVKRATEQAGFRVVRVVSTLMGGPADPPVAEPPQEGHVRGASFVVVVAEPAS